MSEICVSSEIEVVPICKFYRTIYKRMVIHFGYSSARPFWLCDMDEEELLRSILNLVISKRMYIVFINVAIRIRKNNNRCVDILTKYKLSNPDVDRIKKRKDYYDENMERIKEYNHYYHLFRASGINIFKKNKF